MLPDLTTITETGLAQDERVSDHSTLLTHYLSESLNARPLSSLLLTGDYRLSRYTARQRTAPGTRQSLNARGTLRLTSKITAQGETSWSREAGRDYTTWDALLGWLPTAKLSFSAGVNRDLPDQTASTTLYSLQSLFRVSPRMDFSGGYSYFDSGETAARNYSNLRFGFNLSL